MMAFSAFAHLETAENALIYWADETGVSNCEIVERGFSPKGRPPVLSVETKRQRVNMLSAVNSDICSKRLVNSLIFR